jgi:hypothetical protein
MFLLHLGMGVEDLSAQKKLVTGRITFFVPSTN